MNQDVEMAVLESWVDGKYDYRWHGQEIELTFDGDVRDWDIHARVSGGWLMLRAYVVLVPSIAAEQRRIFEVCLKLSDGMAVSKVTLNGQQIHACLEVCFADVNEERFHQLIWMLRAQCDEIYSALYPIAEQSVMLSRLEQRFKKS